MKKSTRKARVRASTRWARAHKDKQRHYFYKSCAKTFITQRASNAELRQFAKLIRERLGE